MQLISLVFPEDAVKTCDIANTIHGMNKDTMYGVAASTAAAGAGTVVLFM